MTDLIIELRKNRNWQDRDGIVDSLRGHGDEYLIKQLLAVLYAPNEDDDLYHYVAHTLAHIGPAAIAGLTAIAKDPHSPDLARSHAVNGLWFMKAPTADETLIAALQDPHPYVRGSAAYGLGELKAKHALQALLNVIDDPDLEVRKPVIFALGQISDVLAIEPLKQALADPEWEVRCEAAAALGQIGREGIQWLLPLSKSTDAETRLLGVSGLHGVQDNLAIESLIASLEDSDSEICEQAVESLRAIGAMAVQPLLACLRYKSNPVQQRANAAKVLGKIHDMSTLDPLIEALNDEKALVRKEIATALSLFRSDKTLDVLMDALSDPDPLVRQSAANAIRNWGDKRATDALIRLLVDNDVEVRSAGALALELAGDERAVIPLAAALKDVDRNVRFHAAIALRRIGATPNVVAALIEALRDEYHYVRSVTIQILDPLHDPRSVEPLIAALNDQDNEIQSRAAGALKGIGTPEAMQAINNWEDRRSQRPA